MRVWNYTDDETKVDTKSNRYEIKINIEAVVIKYLVVSEDANSNVPISQYKVKTNASMKSLTKLKLKMEPKSIQNQNR